MALYKNLFKKSGANMVLFDGELDESIKLEGGQ